MAKNACDKDIKDEYRYGNKHVHFLDYNDWCGQLIFRPHPIIPLNMLESMDYTGEQFFANVQHLLRKHGITLPGTVNLSKSMLEIGGRYEGNYSAEENFWGLKYYNLNLENKFGCERTLVGDITKCDLPDNSYDFIYSMDTFEHINRPWLAAKEIERLLKPGGIAFIVTLFSWRYHPDPIDYWRFSPHCLKFLFDGLDCIEANWDIRNRRVPIQGHEGDNDICPEDHFGPWLENWRVYYIGRKSK